MLIRKRRKESQKLDFTLSLSDIMSGLLFIFIITLIYFIMEAQNIKREYSENRQLQREVLISLKKKIEKELRRAFKKENIEVEHFEDQGVLRLPDQYFFKSGEYELYGQGKVVIKSLKKHIYETLSCDKTKIEGLCEGGKLKVESFFIEGHTDCDQIGPSLQRRRKQPVYSNIHLSSMRAISAFNELVEESNLMTLTNLKDEPIFSVSGHGPFRPANDTKKCAWKKTDKAKDRRIEFKVVMHLPKKLREKQNL